MSTNCYKYHVVLWKKWQSWVGEKQVQPHKQVPIMQSFYTLCSLYYTCTLLYMACSLLWYYDNINHNINTINIIDCICLSCTTYVITLLVLQKMSVYTCTCTVCYAHGALWRHHDFSSFHENEKNRGVFEKNGCQAVWSKIQQNGSCNQLFFVGRFDIAFIQSLSALLFLEYHVSSYNKLSLVTYNCMAPLHPWSVHEHFYAPERTGVFFEFIVIYARMHAHTFRIPLFWISLLVLISSPPKMFPLNSCNCLYYTTADYVFSFFFFILLIHRGWCYAPKRL